MKGIIVALLMSLLLCASNAFAVEVDVIQVEAHSFNAYGHWICDDGVVELRVDGSMLTADGWPISPILSAREDVQVSSAAKKPRDPVQVTLEELGDLRDKMLADGASKDAVVEASIDFLERSGLLDGSVSHSSGYIYVVPWKGKDPAYVNFVDAPPKLTANQMEALQKQAAEAMLDIVARNLRAGDVVLVTSLPMPRISFIPSFRRSEAVALLTLAKDRQSEITQDNWESNGLVDAGFAEQQRRPMPDARKRGGQ